MDDNTIEIHDDEINVEEIMAKIRENIRRRQAAGELPLDPDSVIESPSKNCPAGESDEAIGRDLSNINANWDIHNNSYFISSHHPCIGTVLVKGRQLVHGEVRRYVDPMIFRQTRFNSSVVRLLNHTSQNCAELEHNISHQNEELTQKISQQDEVLTQKISQQDEVLTQKISQQDEVLTQKISQQDEVLTQKISQQDEVLTQKISQWEDVLTQKISHQNENLNTNIQNCVDSNFREVFSHLDKDIRLQMGLTQLLEERMQKGLAQRSTPSESTATPNDTNYFLFEERFRGSREDIKQRQLAFLPYFEKCSRVLDIGSGRGEFLEILKDHGIGGIGVDIDPDMVTYCRSRHLEVEHSDALTYLETLEDKSLDGIFIDQVVEHLEPDYLIRLIALCHQKMKFGYHIVIETVNPLSFVSFANFYIDLTHKRPIHPETLQYLISAVGFRECEKKFFSPVSDAGRLKKIEMTVDMHETERKNVDVYNHNIEMLNSILFGAQDYAVVGKK
ncbi:class I SAM-dependent methyltransferase [Methanoregula sp.]|uniref:class I SAM-dependent methyltransferase n=1 Tax=Methanoregula sp. TaxID=2052170 RepID=UPI00356AF7FA